MFVENISKNLKKLLHFTKVCDIILKSMCALLPVKVSTAVNGNIKAGGPLSEGYERLKKFGGLLWTH